MRRIRTAREFKVWEGGGEYNVVRGLRRCFGLRTAVVTAIVDNEVGRLLEDLMLQGGVDLSHVKWVPFDGIGRDGPRGAELHRAGLRPAGGLRLFRPRPLGGLADEARRRRLGPHLPAGRSALVPLRRDLRRARPPPPPNWPSRPCRRPARPATIVSYDLNFRASLWKSQGGTQRAVEVNRRIAPLVDVMIGNEEDFTAALGFQVPGLDEHLSQLDPANFRRMIAEVAADVPQLPGRGHHAAQRQDRDANDWGAILYGDGQFHEAPLRENLEIYDRVGGGDSFASGLIYAFLAGKTPQQAVEYGAAHGALAMTTPGDTSMATLKEVEAVMRGKGARIVR